MPTVAEQMLTDALAAQKFTRKFFVVELDFSETSVAELDAQSDAARYALRGGLTPENIDKLANLWGSYLGELLRRHAGGEWTTAETANGPRPAILLNGATVFPHDIVRTRLETGPDAAIKKFFESARK